MSVSQATINKMNALSPQYQRIVVEQVDRFSEMQKETKKPVLGAVGRFFFKRLVKSGQKHPMTDAEMEETLSAARAERHASGH